MNRARHDRSTRGLVVAEGRRMNTPGLDRNVPGPGGATVISGTV